MELINKTILYYLAFGDILATWIALSYQKYIAKNKRWNEMERNPLPRYFIRKFGITYGLMLTSSFGFLFLTLFILQDVGIAFFIGVYYVIYLIHFNNLIGINKYMRKKRHG